MYSPNRAANPSAPLLNPSIRVPKMSRKGYILLWAWNVQINQTLKLNMEFCPQREGSQQEYNQSQAFYLHYLKRRYINSYSNRMIGNIINISKPILQNQIYPLFVLTSIQNVSSYLPLLSYYYPLSQLKYLYLLIHFFQMEMILLVKLSNVFH